MEEEQMTQVNAFPTPPPPPLSGAQQRLFNSGALPFAGGGAALLPAVRLHVGSSCRSGQTLGPDQRESPGAQTAGAGTAAAILTQPGLSAAVCFRRATDGLC